MNSTYRINWYYNRISDELIVSTDVLLINFNFANSNVFDCFFMKKIFRFVLAHLNVEKPLKLITEMKRFFANLTDFFGFLIEIKNFLKHVPDFNSTNKYPLNFTFSCTFYYLGLKKCTTIWKQWNQDRRKGGLTSYFFATCPTFAFFVPRTFFILFLRSLRCLRVIFLISTCPWRARRCFGSNFLA